MKNVVILFTGAVDVANVMFTERKDDIIRLNDYKKSIAKWRENNAIKIVFIENSSYPIELLGEEFEVNDNFELLSNDGRKYAKERGKGSAEFIAIKYAIGNSYLIKEADYIIKITGRYYFNNINKLIKALDKLNFDILGNFSRGLSFMHSRVFIFKPSFFHDYFINYFDEIDDSKEIYFEHALAMATHECLSDGGKWTMMPVSINIEGILATTDNVYKVNILTKLKSTLKFIIKKLVYGKRL